MRILAIRGKNIASLAHKFELDLTAPPLDQTGLFAITGPTGSGKSTLLDVLCLALFDRIPRMNGGKSFKIALGQEDEQELSSTDVRNILRRGEAEALAEVDFLGNDRQRYRSTWHVRRARARAGKIGLLQKQTLSLMDLETMMPLGGHTKTELLRLIEQKLGLDFEQFRRSVLLAQGEFAAFLRAESKQRSDLLERMTGTQIYSRISMAAYAKTKEERERLQRMNDELSALTVLDADALDELTVRVQAAEKQKNSFVEELALCRKALAWLQSLDQLTQARDQAHGQWREAEDRRESLRETEEKLAAVLAVQPLRGDIESLDRCLATWAGLNQQWLEVNGNLERLTAESALLTKKLTEAKYLETQCLAVYEKARPDLDRARGWDSVLTERKKQLKKQSGLVRELKKDLSRDEKFLEDLVKRESEAEKARHEARSWLAEQKQLEPLAGEWFHWKKEIERYERVNHEHGDSELRYGRETAELERIARELESRTKDFEGSSESAKTLAKLLSEVRNKAETFDREALDSQRDGLLESKVFLETRMSLDREEASLVEACHELEFEGETLRGGLAEIEQRLPCLMQEQETLRVRLEEAERGLKLSESSLTFEERRHELLMVGEACPLCGSKEHPYLEGADRGSLILREQKKRVSRLRKDQQKRIGEASSLNTSRAANQKRVTEIAVQLEQRLDKRAALVKKRDSLSGNSAPNPGVVDLLTAHGETALAEILTRLEVVEAERKKADDAKHEEERVQREFRAKTEAVERFRELQFVLEKKVLQKREGVKGLTKDLERSGEELATSLTRFQLIFSDELKQDLLRSDPSGFLEICETRVSQWRDYSQKLTHADERLSDLAGKRAVLDTSRGERHMAWNNQAEELSGLMAQQTQLQQQRATVFEGRNLAVVEHEFSLRIKTAKDDVEQFRQEFDGLNGKKNSLLGRQSVLERERIREQEEKELLEKSLAHSTTATGKNETDVRALLRVEPQWIRDQQKKIQAVEDRRAHCQTIYEERREQVVAHRASMEPEPRPAETQALETRLNESINEIELRLNRDRLEILRDEEKRGQRLLKAPLLLEQQRQTEWWEVLNRLIGSADGGKFRKYAQSLTLDSLITHANDHLRDLARRYELERVPGEDLELQVIDHDMGDDIRALNSLSGGETFLVSLALALGLSSLSSQQTQIESLFIDEGFGTLDAHTLDSALNVLDTLQSEGRQIGIISHVPAVAERIGVRVQIQKAANGSSLLKVVSD